MTFSRIIPATTYVSYAKKYGISVNDKDGKPKSLSVLSKAIYAYETKHKKKGFKGLYYY